MPQHYHTKPVALELVRCLLVRVALEALLTGIWLVAKALPPGHPARIYLNGRVPQLRECLMPALIPASRADEAAVARQRRFWLGGVLFLAALIVGDVSASVPVDLFGLPDTHLGIGALLGLEGDDLLGTPHILSTRLPWSDGGREGVALLLACIGTVYALRPRTIASAD